MSNQALTCVNPDDFPVVGDIKDLFSTIVIAANQVAASSDFISDLLVTIGPKPNKNEIDLLLGMEKQF